MMYDYQSKNVGKDLIYQTRLRLACSMGIDIENTNSRMYAYLMEAKLGIILI